MSFSLKRDEKNHIAAIYTFARTADDLADNELLTLDERRAKLAILKSDLIDCYNGRFKNEFFMALSDTLETCDIEQSLLNDLLAAFEIDLTVNRYQTLDDLLNYSVHSANPIGRILLKIFHEANPLYLPYSDALCTSLQLINCLQGVGEDLVKGRIYLPHEECIKHGVSEEDILNKKYGPPFIALMDELADRAQDKLQMGIKLAQLTHYRCSIYISAIGLSAKKMLSKLRAQQFNVFTTKITLTKFEKLKIALQAMTERF